MSSIPLHCSSIRVAVVLLSVVLWPTGARSGTPYEAQIGGFIYASLQTFILGEFAGRRTTNTIGHAKRRPCRPEDFIGLRQSARDERAVSKFEDSCHTVHFQVGETHVHGTAYLPDGPCNALKVAYDDMLAKQVYADLPGELVVFEYKGSNYLGSRRSIARGARLQTECLPDGSIRVSAPRRILQR
jgi:hypothetical protein